MKFKAGLKLPKGSNKISIGKAIGEKAMAMKGKHGVGKGSLSKAVGAIKKRNQAIKKIGGK